jgi:serine kinase of HPr protein (carbohydrate metabolism regulator)
MATANIHASCVVLGSAGRAFRAPEDTGVLILGASGSGKSDLVLRLVERGAELVADDRVELFVSDGKLWGSPPPELAGLAEIRGVGIVSLAYRRDAEIRLAVELIAPELVPRSPEAWHYAPPEALGLPEVAHPPLIRLAGFQCSTPAKVAAAAVSFAHGLHRDNHNPI